MKQVAILVMLVVIGGNILKNAEQYNSEHPVIYVAEAHTDEPKEILIGTKIEWTKERIAQEIEERAAEYGVSASEMKRVIQCESQGSTTIQSYHRYTFSDEKRGIVKGERELSFGLSQIHLPHHPTVTKEQAIDPKFAIDFMAKNWKRVTWSCK